MHRADKYIIKSASRNQADSKHIKSAISANYYPIMSASYQQWSRYLPMPFSRLVTRIYLPAPRLGRLVRSAGALVQCDLELTAFSQGESSARVLKPRSFTAWV
jgi:hypothetical protein